MKLAIDTNIIICVLDHGSALHARAVRALDFAAARGDEVVLLPIVIHESWAVLTRPPSANGLGWPPIQAAAALRAAMRRMPLVPDPADLTEQWLTAVAAADVAGRRAHDWRLATAARLAKVDAVLTFNTGDFAEFPGLDVLEPAAEHHQR